MRSTVCTKCSEFAYLNNDRCQCQVSYAFNPSSKQCENYMIPHCISYDETLKCNQCKEFFSLEDGNCICYTEVYNLDNESCTEIRLELIIQSYTNRIDLNFSNKLKDHFYMGDIELSFSDNQIEEKLTYKLTEISEFQVYSYEFEYPTDLDTEVIAYLLFTLPFSDRLNHTLEYDFYEVPIHLLFIYDSVLNSTNQTESITETENISNNSSIEEQETQTIRNETYHISIAFTEVSLFTSILNHNPSSFLRMINTLQIYRYLLLFNITLPTRVKSICLGYNPLKSFPNIALNILEASGTELNDKYRDFGLKTSDFLINSGKQISILILFFTVYLVLKISRNIFQNNIKNLILKKIYLKILSSFEYGVFINFWIQGYLDFIISAGLNLLNPLFTTSHDIASFILSTVFLVRYKQILSLLSPIVLLLFYIRNFNRLSDDNFSAKWDSLYVKYDLSKEYAVLEMIYFLMRRIMLGSSLLILNEAPYIQISMISVIAFGNVIFYLFHNPFRARKERNLSVFLETCAFIVTSIGIFIKEDLSEIMTRVIDWSISGVLYLTILVPAVLDALEIIKTVYFLILKGCNRLINRNHKNTPVIS